MATGEEIAYLETVNIHEDGEPEVHFAEYLGDDASEMPAIERRHVKILSELPAIHADPFDRMLVARALVEDLDLVTGDDLLESYPIRAIW